MDAVPVAQQQINISRASQLIPLHPAVPHVHFAPLINICLSASLVTPAIHQRATEAAAPPQRGENRHNTAN